MTRKLSKAEINRMQAGRFKQGATTIFLVCRIEANIEIWADKYQFILKINQKHEGNYSDISYIIAKLLDIKAKELMIADNRKNLVSVHEAIIDAHKWVEDVVGPLLK